MLADRAHVLRPNERMLSALRSRLAGAADAGFTLVEVMMVVLVVTVSSFTLIDALASTSRLTHGSQRQAQAVVYAQGQIEKIKAYTWSQIALTSTPSHTTTGNTLAGDNNPLNPNYYVNGTQFRVSNNWRDLTDNTGPGNETLVTGGAVQPTASIPASTGIQGTVYSYVTQVPSLQARDPLGSLVGTLSGANQRRITVAVVLTGQKAVGPGKPIWVTSTISNPQTCPAGLVLHYVGGVLNC